MVEYQPSDLPFFGQRVLPRREARELFKHYVALIPERVAMLAAVVRATPGDAFETWAVDMDRESLVILGDWLAQQVLCIPLSEPEREQWLDRNRKHLPERYWATLEPPDEDFDWLSYALMIDVGMYFGEALRVAVPDVRWQLGTTAKTGIAYHKPVLETIDPISVKGGLRRIRQRTCPQDSVHGVVLSQVARRQRFYLHDVYDLCVRWLRGESDE